MNLRAHVGWLLSKLLYEWNLLKRVRKRRFYAKFIGPGDLCFDVGAHLGDRAHTWLKLGAKVVAFEPQPRFVDYLANKFDSQSDFFLEDKGLADVAGTHKLAMSALYPTLASLAGEKWHKELNDASQLSIKFDAVVDIEVTTLDEMIQVYGLPKFCKIDVEGFEFEVLMGLSQPLPILSFEFLSFSEDRMMKCMARLQQLGYSKFNWSYKETFKLRFEDWIDAHSLTDDIKHFKRGLFSGDIYAMH